MARKPINLFAITILLLATNCHQAEVEEKPDCGCQGNVSAVVTDAPARIPDGGIIYPQIMLKEAAIRTNAYTKDFIVCSKEKIDGLLTSIKTGTILTSSAGILGRTV